MNRSPLLDARRLVAACAVLAAGVSSAQFLYNTAGATYSYHDPVNWTDEDVNGRFTLAPDNTAALLLLATNYPAGLTSITNIWGANANRTIRVGGFNAVASCGASGFNTTTETITTEAAHGFATGDRIICDTPYSGNVGIGRGGTERYAAVVSATEFKLSLTADGTNIVDLNGTPNATSAFRFAKIPAINAGSAISFTKTTGAAVNSFAIGVDSGPALTNALTLQLTSDLTVHAQNNGTASGTAEVRINQGMAGSYGIVKTGNGLLSLGAAANGPPSIGNFTGGVAVNEGSLHVVAWPTLTGTTLVGSPAGLGTLTFASGTTLLQGNANYTIANPIDAGSGNVTFSQGGDGTTTLSGILAGSGTLTLMGTTGTGRRIRFSGASANTLAGTVEAVGQVALELAKNTGIAAMASGTIRMQDSSILRFPGTTHHNLTQAVTVSMEGSSQMAFDANVNRQSVGKLLLNTSHATPILMTKSDAWLSVGEHTTLANTSGPAVHLRNGGVLGGAASLNLQLRISAAGGQIAPGTGGDGTVGTLTLAGGFNQTAAATYRFELGGAAGAADLLKLSGGAVSFTSGNVIDLAQAGVASVASDTWTTLIDTTGATSLSGFTLENFTAGEIAEALGSPIFQIIGSGNDQQLQVSFPSGGTVILVQ